MTTGANQVRNQSPWTHDEAFGLNLPGRLNADAEIRKDGMSLHNSIKIATWNVRSLKSIRKLSIVGKEMERHNISVLGLAHVRLDRQRFFCDSRWTQSYL